ncbi:ATP-binding protein [Xylanibacillus composti]|nr:AAA family ATPase [Xylanibacillus composti]MDT9727140.1 ATP-binding protein [Xylanibacillus composti]
MFFLQMSGFPGSGKTTLSRRVAQITGAIIVDHDTSKTALLKAAEGHDIELWVIGKFSYTVDWELIDFYLSQRKSVIFDSPCLYPEMIFNGLNLSSKHKVNYKYVECYLNNRTEINRRLKARDRLISQLESTTQESFDASINNSQKPPSNVEYLTVDSSQPLDTYLDKVINYLK